MSDLYYREWWPSAASRQRGAAPLAWLYWGGRVVLYLGERAPFVGSDSSHEVCHVDVTGRSDAHVDRLARDWIGHGVSPTTTGGRGVARPDRRERTPWGWRRSTSREALRRFDRAEARAARVVSR